MTYLTLLAGIVVLLVSGDLLVRGSVGLAERLGIPAMIIGLTIVAFGTSAPELVVSLEAALSGSPGIAVGNVVGSNIANILLVMGLPALVATTTCDEADIERNAVYVLGASILFIALAHIGPLTYWHGAILMTLMVVFLVETGRRANNHRNGAISRQSANIEEIDGVSGVPHRWFGTVAFIAVGIAGLPAGGHLTVDAARQLALQWGVSEAAVGLTVVALGTSLPELATSLVAAMRRHCGLALGNVLGSNLFNILGIMGIVAITTPVDVPPRMVDVDLWIMLLATLLVMPFAMWRRTLSRTVGLIFTVLYIVYVAIAIAPSRTALAGLF